LTPFAHATSAVSLAVITINLVFWLALAIPTSVLRLVLPGFAPTAHRLLDAIYRGAVRVDDFWLGRVVGVRWSMPTALDLDPGRTWVVLSNHVSWADIFLIQSLLVRHGLVVQFLSKRELLAVPVVGLVIWAFEFPVLRRTARRGGSEAVRKARDFEALRAACRRARENPVGLMCFAEGTRATPARRADRHSPYRHLLPPRVGGFGALCDGLGESLAGVVDCTLFYRRACDERGARGAAVNEVTFWEFLAGEVSEIELHAERIPAPAIPLERDERARWLDARWAVKDAWLVRRGESSRT
jgi:1-acyl-sn-glycerol-3-phosphate acyltransferase